jgi:quinol monooxygenase YgiN
MSVPVLIGFAGVLVAAVATGMLAGRCVRQPRIAFIVWTAATLALTVALAAESMGFERGFGPATFRAVQLFALLLAPLWLAWGLAELLWPGEAARFGARLVCGALTVIGSVILVTDPLTATAFGKSWPLASQHYQPPSHYALDAAQTVAVLITVAATILAAMQARNDPRMRSALVGAAPVGLAVLITAGLRFSLPDRSAYPLIGVAAAALAWFGATRLERLPGPAGRPARDDRGRAAADDAPRTRRGPGGLREPATGSYPPGDPGEPGPWPDPGRRPAPPGPDRPRGDAGSTGPRPHGSAPRALGSPGAPDRRLAPPPRATGPDAVLAAADDEFGTPANRAGAPPAAPARPYGRILIFTLLDDRVADFDRLAEQAAEEVRTREPDTLVYVIHLVPNAPMQRIFYEIYRDRAAFDSHESQPYMQRFVADRRSCVLATNVIELRLKYAKVAPLPNPASLGEAAPPGPRAQLPPGRTQGTQTHGTRAQGTRAQGTRAPEALDPLPPGPDRRLPSAGGHYGGI